MAKITFPNKQQAVDPNNPQPNEKFLATDANEIKDSVNAAYDLLDGKASKVGGLVPEGELPPVIFEGLLGTGTDQDPFYFQGSGGGQASAEDYLKSLPGYLEGEEKILYGGGLGGFSWGPVPAGALPSLSPPVLSLGTPSVNGVSADWTAIENATAYQLQRSTNVGFTSPVTIYTGSNTQFTDSTLNANTQYYFRVRAVASGYASSSYDTETITTPASGNITPPTPTNAVVNDSANTFDWVNSTGYANISNYEGTIDGGSSYQQLTTKPWQLVDANYDVNQVGVRIKADTGRNVSGTLFNQTAYTITPITPPAPTNGIVDDTANTFDWTNSVGFSNVIDYEYVLDGSTNYQQLTEKPIFVGDISAPAGNVKVRVKAASGRTASQFLSNATGFLPSPQLGVPLVNFTYNNRFSISDTNDLHVTDSVLGANAALAYSIPEGQEGWISQTYEAFVESGEQGTGVIYIGIGLDPFYGASDSIGYINSVDTGVVIGKSYSSAPGKALVGAILRLRADLTQVHMEVSNNGGATYEILRSVSRPAGVIRFKLAGISNQHNIKNLRGFNLTSV